METVFAQGIPKHGGSSRFVREFGVLILDDNRVMAFQPGLVLDRRAQIQRQAISKTGHIAVVHLFAIKSRFDATYKVRGLLVGTAGPDSVSFGPPFPMVRMYPDTLRST